MELFDVIMDHYINNDHFEEFGDYFFEKACELFKLNLDE